MLGLGPRTVLQGRGGDAPAMSMHTPASRECFPSRCLFTYVPKNEAKDPRSGTKRVGVHWSRPWAASSRHRELLGERREADTQRLDGRNGMTKVEGKPVLQDFAKTQADRIRAKLIVHDHVLGLWN